MTYLTFIVFKAIFAASENTSKTINMSVDHALLSISTWREVKYRQQKMVQNKILTLFLVILPFLGLTGIRFLL